MMKVPRKTTRNKAINHTLLPVSPPSLLLMQPEDGGRTNSSASSSSSAKNKTLSNPSHHTLRFCGVEHLVFPSPAAAEEEQASRSTDNSSSGNRRNESVATVHVDYQCRGQAYDKFTNRLELYVKQLSRSMSNHSQWWGKRDVPFPDNASIMAIGNSHTKQTIVTLLCQYKDQVQTLQNLGPRDIPDSVFFFQVTFFNNASLLFAGNHPFAYSHQWHNHFQKYDPLNRSLHQFDTIILGQFNPYINDSETGFQKLMMEFSNRHPEWIDFEHDPAPSLEDLVKLVQSSSSTSNKPSPIILVLPMYTDNRGKSWELKTRDTASKLVSLSRGSSHESSATSAGTSIHTTVKVLHTRQHIEALGTECGSTVRHNISKCLKNPNLHRGTGPRGGDADLVAWDLIEAVHQEQERRRQGQY